MMQYATLADTVYFWFGANNTSGTGADGATGVYDVRLGGASSSAAPVLSGSATLLTHANYPDGCWEVAIVASSGNGFAADGCYAVFCTLLVDSQNPTGFVGSFKLSPIPSSVSTVASTAWRYFGITDAGTAQSVPDSTHLQLRSALAVGDAALSSGTLLIAAASTGAGQSRLATNNVGATDTVSFDAMSPALTGTVEYVMFGTAPASLTAYPLVQLAATTHTGAVVPTVTNLTNAPTVGDLTATMKASVTTAASASTPSVTLNSSERNAIADAHLDRADAIEVGLTPRNAHKLAAAAAAGKISGAASTSVVIRNAVADSKSRITATVDSSGNRTAITTDLT